jgi:hypothetical protein
MQNEMNLLEIDLLARCKQKLRQLNDVEWEFVCLIDLVYLNSGDRRTDEFESILVENVHATPITNIYCLYFEDFKFRKFGTPTTLRIDPSEVMIWVKRFDKDLEKKESELVKLIEKASGLLDDGGLKKFVSKLGFRNPSTVIRYALSA